MLLETSGAKGLGHLRLYLQPSPSVEAGSGEFCYIYRKNSHANEVTMSWPSRDRGEGTAPLGNERKWFPGTESLRRNLPLFLPPHVDRKLLNVRLRATGKPARRAPMCGSWSPKMAPNEPRLPGLTPLCGSCSHYSGLASGSLEPAQCGRRDIV